ncbi:LuxR C-terminal-related transcriptional regulator [Streptomyces sp. NPDC050095]|uniref:response regulator transcription factor n=1 Tax=unclassified Streptomyces TaxID=2593676 RepID=UPI00343D20B9
MNVTTLQHHLSVGARAMDIPLAPEHVHTLALYVAKHTTPMGPGKPLTQRQYDVLLGILRGESNAQSGRRLCLSTDTVKTHRRRLYAVMGAKNAAHAVHIAYLRGLLGGDSR